MIDYKSNVSSIKIMKEFPKNNTLHTRQGWVKVIVSYKFGKINSNRQKMCINFKVINI